METLCRVIIKILVFITSPIWGLIYVMYDMITDMSKDAWNDISEFVDDKIDEIKEKFDKKEVDK